MSKIESEKFGEIDGQVVHLFRLINNRGCYIEIISYGATIKSINVLGENSEMGNIILGYETLEGYLSNTHYLGATIGRFANRISNASFVMDDNHYFLNKNDGNNCNHGGFTGFDKKVFECQINEGKLSMVVKSSHGEAGFPGNITLTIIYQLTDENELFIDYHVLTDRKTPVNITNHAYFNLSGEENILNHQLKVEADTFIEANVDFLPTGKCLKMENNPCFDFRVFKEIGMMMQLKQEKIGGYNSYFIAREKSKELKKLAILKSEKKNRSVEVYSTMPGIMIYTGDFLSGVHTPFSGISLEAQYYPDSPNQPLFPQDYFAFENYWKETILYRFISDSAIFFSSM